MTRSIEKQLRCLRKISPQDSMVGCTENKATTPKKSQFFEKEKKVLLCHEPCKFIDRADNEVDCVTRHLAEIIENLCD